MVSYPIENYIEETGWQDILGDYWVDPAFQELLKKLELRQSEATVYPPASLRFKAFDLCPFHQTKALILGQDPYHGAGQAHGLSFSVPMGQKLPPSLRNIFKELKNDLDIEPAFSGDLSPWAEQGLLLLNSSLSVEEGKAGAHAKWGWEEFSDFVIKALSDKKEAMVFILWGNWAKSKIHLIDAEKHLVISSAHPSPLSARHGFFGSKPFSRCNEFLKQKDRKTINWKLPC